MYPIRAQFSYKIIKVKPLTGAIGAEIEGVDLSRSLDEATKAEVMRAFSDHLVIYFYNQLGFTRERHIDFARMFGPIQNIPHGRSVDGYPDVQIVRYEPGRSRTYVGNGFHIDSSFLKTPPTTVTMHCIETPAVGGDTVFANLQLGYATLSTGMKRLLDDLRAIHRDNRTLFPHHDPVEVMIDALGGEFENAHPIVRTHPYSGLKNLFITEAYTRRIEGFTEEESYPILHFLCEHAAWLDYTCRVRWRKNMVLVWDNRCTYHSGIADYSELRYLERVTTGGEVPI
ncbi:MAG: TauD/TfdA dioxygenase family protein [Candidatus Binatia bacterium]